MYRRLGQSSAVCIRFVLTTPPTFQLNTQIIWLRGVDVISSSQWDWATRALTIFTSTSAHWVTSNCLWTKRIEIIEEFKNKKRKNLFFFYKGWRYELSLGPSVHSQKLYWPFLTFGNPTIKTDYGQRLWFHETKENQIQTAYIAHETITLHTFNMHTQLARVLNGSCSSHPLHVSIGQGSYIVCHMNIVCFYFSACLGTH